MKSRWVWRSLLAALGADRLRGQRARDAATGLHRHDAREGDVRRHLSHVHTVPASWNEQIQTKGDSDLYVQQNTWQPGRQHRAGTRIRGRAS